MISVVLAFSVGVPLTLLVVGVGFWAGYEVAKNSISPIVMKSEEQDTEGCVELFRQLRASRAIGQRLVSRSGQLSEAAKLTPQLASELRTKIEQVHAIATELQSRLSSFDNVKTHRIAHSLLVTEPDSISASHDTTLTQQEIVRLTPGAMPDETSEHPITQRYQFHCIQSAAPWVPGQPFPTASEFRPVKCRDISVAGISFLWPDEPEFDNVVIAIAVSGSPVYMAAEITHSRAVFMFGQLGYLVGCKFTGRMMPPIGFMLGKSDELACSQR